METEFTRREALAGMGATATLGLLLSFIGSDAMASSNPGDKAAFMHELPPLPYPEAALEPFIDKETVKIHYEKHFAGYVKGLNTVLGNLEKARKEGNFDSIKALSRNLAFHGSGVVLHWIYFTTIGPNAGGQPTGVIADLINRDFGSFDAFWKQFAAASKDVEASGWGILAWEPFSKRLVVMQAEKHRKLLELGGHAAHGVRRLGTHVLFEISEPATRIR